MPALLVLAALASTSCYVPYVRDVVRGSTRPERVSWLIWSVLGSIAVFTQVDLGVGPTLVLAITHAVGCTTVFLLSITRSGQSLGTADLVAIFVSCNAIVAWHFTNNAISALVIVLAIDAIAASLTVMKAYRDPRSETTVTWMLAGFAGIATLVAAGTWTNAIYPAYTVAMNAAVLTALCLGKKRSFTCLDQ